ncbi:MAG: hypothetical protein GKR90_05965 [Pseudomonadales bacterium]|nr:hypothetical protein [Pseudomonadales bacterium]
MSRVSTEYEWPKVGVATNADSFWQRMGEPSAGIEPSANKEPSAGVRLSTDQHPTTQDDVAPLSSIDQGYADGRTAAEQEIQATIEVLSQAAEELERVNREQSKNSLTDAVDIVQGLFRAVFGLELRTNPKVLKHLETRLQEELDQKENERVTFRFADEDFAKLSSDVSSVANARLVADPSLAPGVVRIQVGHALRELDVCANLENSVMDVLNDFALADDESVVPSD